MQVQEFISLLPFNTFGIDYQARYFAELTDPVCVEAAPQEPLHIIGGGSNILLTGPLQGTVWLNRLKGIRMAAQDEAFVWLDVYSGEIWHELVCHTLSLGLGGLENLALIPGTVGAAPIQNIGAYGVEAAEVIESVTYRDLKEQRTVTIAGGACRFGYRDSIFKQELKGRIFILSVRFRLSKHPILRIDYGTLREELKRMGVETPTLRAVADAVISVRRSKLPDPAVTGNAGSFFKNPVISPVQFRTLREQNPAVPFFHTEDDLFKIPAAWLIEQCGWKGFREGQAGVHDRQPLVLVNHGLASGSDILLLSEHIMASVSKRFGIRLEREVQIW